MRHPSAPPNPSAHKERSVGRDVLVSVTTALTLFIGAALYNYVSRGGLVALLGGVTKSDFDEWRRTVITTESTVRFRSASAPEGMYWLSATKDKNPYLLEIDPAKSDPAQINWSVSLAKQGQTSAIR